MQTGIALAVAILLSLASVAHATIWYVHPDSALNSIQAGLDSCSIHDTVLVAPSTYFENITWPDVQGIKLLSESGAAATIIDGNSDTNIIYINVAVDSMTVIHGFTIQNGTAGIYCEGINLDHCCPTIIYNLISNTTRSISCIWSSPIIKNNTITDNTGEGVYCYGSNSAIIDNNYIYNNMGVGIVCDLSSPYIIANAIIGNMTGIVCWNSSPVIEGTAITSNTSDGMELFDSYPTIDSCTISNNGGHGIFIDLIFYESPHINYNNITNNDGYGILYAASEVMVDAENNWWSDPSGPGGVGPGTGDEVSMNVDYDPWLADPIGVEEHESPQKFFLDLQIMPNPFKDKINIKFDANCDIKSVNIKIYDISGRVIKQFNQLTNNKSPVYQLSWNGKDNSDKPVPSGIYFLRFYADYFKETHKLILMR